MYKALAKGGTWPGTRGQRGQTYNPSHSLEDRLELRVSSQIGNLIYVDVDSGQRLGCPWEMKPSVITKSMDVSMDGAPNPP